jgi:hypothetical protein
MWSGLIVQWPSQKIAKTRQALRLTRKVFNFHLHVKFTCFNILTEIFGFFSSNHEITTREGLSPQHSQRVGSYGQFQSCWTNPPKSLCNYMGPLYFNIRTLVFDIRTSDSTYIEFEYVKSSMYIDFEYVKLSTYMEFECVFRVIKISCGIGWLLAPGFWRQSKHFSTRLFQWKVECFFLIAVLNRYFVLPDSIG